MKKIIELLRKVKPNHIVLFNVIVILIIFIAVNKYNSKINPTKVEKFVNGIKYTLTINRHRYSKNSIMIINLNLENRAKKPKEIEILREVMFNVEILNSENIVYKRDYIDALALEKRHLNLAGYGKITLGFEWNLIPNGDVKDIKPGKYLVRVYTENFGIDMQIPFEISEEGL